MMSESDADHEVDAGPVTELPDNRAVVLREMQRMDDYEFEHLVADIWEQQDWETSVSTQSVDAGIDVTATRDYPYDEKVLIQAKRYGENTTVGGPDVQQYASLKHQERGVDKVIIVTTGRFTKEARKRAHDLNVKLINGSTLTGLVYDLGCADILDEYNLLPRPNPTPDESAGVVAEPHSPDSNPGGEAAKTTSQNTPGPAERDGRVRGGIRQWFRSLKRIAEEPEINSAEDVLHAASVITGWGWILLLTGAVFTIDWLAGLGFFVLAVYSLPLVVLSPAALYVWRAFRKDRARMQPLWKPKWSWYIMAILPPLHVMFSIYLHVRRDVLAGEESEAGGSYNLAVEDEPAGDVEGVDSDDGSDQESLNASETDEFATSMDTEVRGYD